MSEIALGMHQQHQFMEVTGPHFPHMPHGLYHTAGDVDQYTHDGSATTLTDMLDSAAENMTWGQEYLQQHPTQDKDSIMQFFDDSLKAINHFKGQSQDGYATSAYLAHIEHEMVTVKDKLEKAGSEDKKTLADYLAAAI
mmetsp:Transcript_35106/g.46206  ORF Transcript_35106/g.46206 Transcript_35106/m.46206 type:complete len:139 (-) Transcript_35106:1204-1620(-)